MNLQMRSNFFTQVCHCYYFLLLFICYYCCCYCYYAGGVQGAVASFLFFQLLLYLKLPLNDMLHTCTTCVGLLRNNYFFALLYNKSLASSNYLFLHCYMDNFSWRKLVGVLDILGVVFLPCCHFSRFYLMVS